MRSVWIGFLRYLNVFATTSASIILSVATCSAQEAIILLRNGMTVGPGLRGTVPGVDQSSKSAAALNEEVNSRPVTVLDDSLRVTFFRTSQIQSINPRVEPLTVVRLKNADLRGTGSHPTVAAVKSAAGVTPFDDFGRRIYALTTTEGAVSIQQGITEVSSNFIRVEGLAGERTTIWDMRLALNAVEPEKLRTILFNQVDLNVPQNWLDMVTVFKQAERFREARELLQLAIAKHPELENLRPQLRDFDESNAELMFREVNYRLEAGQYELARRLLQGFDRRFIAAQTSVKIDRRLAEIKADTDAIQKLKQRSETLLRTTQDAKVLSLARSLVDEIKSMVTPSTLLRFADLQQLDRDDERALSVLLSGWLLGSGNTVNTLPMAASLIEARSLVQQYLSSSSPAERDQILAKLRSIEGGTTPYIAKLAALMRPPLELDPSMQMPDIPGRYSVEVTVTAIPDSPKTSYVIQLPPEYDPNRKYPCVFAIPGQFSTPNQEVDWWAGGYNEQFQRCMGEASRHGYVVVSPQWLRPKQEKYEYTENEHALILTCFRDALRRASIDTDRVFLSGHHLGGDAAWDIGLAHPDLWAGLVVISGDCSKYPELYYENARNLPMYFVVGELDGAPHSLARNGKYLDDFMSTAQYDCMVTMYKGRGNDHFQDEIKRILQWMNLSGHRRNFAPNEIDVVAARPGDNFFWYLEVRGIKPSVLIHPFLFEKRKLPKLQANLRKPAANAIRVNSLPADGYTVWIGPEHVQDINQRILLESSKPTKAIEPELDIQVILEDLRTRGDRQHPFWLKVDF